VTNLAKFCVPRASSQTSAAHHSHPFVSKLSSSTSKKTSVTEGWRCAQLC